MHLLAGSVTLPTTGVFAVVAFLGALVVLISPLGAPIRGAWHGGVWLFKYREAERRAAVSRRGFARHIEAQLLRLSDRDDWSDERFTELEAEVEIEGRQRRLVPWGRRGYDNRRVRSLSAALTRSTERLIILQGEPGAGKSVALRHVALTLAENARRGATGRTTLPLYVNLKEFRPLARPVNASHVREFVLDSLNRANNRDVDRYLDAEFDMGLRDGRWLFFFDSFDEIPDVLDATDTDETVAEYTYALEDFLGGANQCRGVIGSREFKGPRRSGWPRFTVARLTGRQQYELVHRALATDDLAAAEVIAGLQSAESSVVDLARNPMLLSLVCEHVHMTRGFPAGAHVVFETFVTTRLARDRSILRHRFSLDDAELRRSAEAIAFCLTQQPGLGLEPTRGRILDALQLSSAQRDWMHTCFDALEYAKLAIPPETTHEREERTFTFVHRRFQEYFATCVVLREPELIPSETLLLSAPWRETAVSVLQFGSGQQTSHLRSIAEAFIENAALEVEPVQSPGSSETLDGTFVWPAGSLHVLGLLVSGISPSSSQLSTAAAEAVSHLLEKAWKTGARHDRVWVIDACGLAEDQVTRRILADGFSSHSILIRDAAFWQVARLRSLPDELRGEIGRTLARLSMRGELRRSRISMYAHLSRLGDSRPLLAAARLLILTPFITIALCVSWIVFGLVLAAAGSRYRLGSGDALILVSYLYLGRLAGARYSVRGDTVGAMRIPISMLATALEYTLIGLVSISTVSILTDKFPGVGASVGFVLLGVYFAAWHAVSMQSAASVRTGGPSRWPLLPIVESPHILRSATGAAIRQVKLAFSKRHNWRDFMQTPAGLLMVVVPSAGALAAGLVYVIDWVSRLHLHFPAWMTSVWLRVLGAVVLVSALVIQLAFIVSRSWAEDRLVRNIVKSSTIDVDQVELLLERLTVEKHLHTFVIELNRRHNGTDEAMDVLFDLAQRCETNPDVRHGTNFIVRQRTLDEIARMIMRVRLASDGSPLHVQPSAG